MTTDAKKAQGLAHYSDPETRNARLADLCRTHFRKLVAYASRRLSGAPLDRRDKAEDVVSRSLLKVIERSPCKSTDTMGAYWHTTVTNELRNEYRHADMRRRTEAALAYERESTHPSPESTYLAQERNRVLQRAIESLSPRRRMAFRLKEWEGLSAREVAGRLTAEGIEVGERQVLRYVDEAWAACRGALEAYEDRKQDRKVVDRKKEGIK
jgi:RNA polymerase sigma factor (sigma-70 family)